jgi:hypothetical protein
LLRRSLYFSTSHASNPHVFLHDAAAHAIARNRLNVS